jgi:lysophospholipase L1-like esterase
MSDAYFPRDEAGRLGWSQVLQNWIASRGVTSTSSGGSTGITQADLDALEAELRAYSLTLLQEAIAYAAAMDMVPPTLSEIRAAVDYYLLTEGGDTLFDESGDGLLLESAP